jgi:pyruvate carboxylase
MITTVAVGLNDAVEKGDRLLVIEAMKMQSTVYAPVSGKITAIHAQAGQQVEAKDLLVVIG